MKILLLSPYPDALLPAIEKTGCEVVTTQEKFTPEFLQEHKINMGISYGYRHILKSDVLDEIPFINLHISYLPWNRGADPNIWSWAEDSPKGVTIHYIDEGIDTGDIIIQKQTAMDKNDTLASSYQKLQIDIEALFNEIWADIYNGTAPRTPQKGEGSLHYAKDRVTIERLIPQGYDTLVSEIKDTNKT